MEPNVDMEAPLAGVRKKRALDVADLPNDVREREGPAKVGRPAKPVQREESQDESDDDESSSDDDALGGLWTDKEDRKRLLQMPELEREMELTRRKESQDDAELLKQLAKSRKGDAAEQSDKEAAEVRRSERKHAAASKQAAKMESLNAMKASRDRQAEAKAQATPTARAESPRQRTDVEDAPPPPLSKTPVRAARPDEERHKESAALRSELASSDEEERHAITTSRRGRPDRAGASLHDGGYDLETETFEASQDEVLSMQVFRENLADWIKHPHLRETLTGAIVRVALTTSTQPGGEGSMCRITDVIDGAPYSFHGSQAQRVSSDKHLMIKTPTDDDHTIQFSLVSNSWVSPEEFERFHDLRSKHKKDQISKREASDVKAQLGFAKSYTLSADDINKIVQQRKAKGLLKKPLNTQRVELLMAKRAAEEKGDETEIERVTRDLEDVLAKIKAKEAEQANFADGDEPLYKKLALVDKKAVAGNRTNFLSANKTADGRKSAGPDPYSRKRTVEKNYWSTGHEKVKAEASVELQEQVEERTEVLTSRKEQLMQLVLPEPVLPLSKELLSARRLLGRQPVLFKPVEDRAGRTTISLDTYITRLEEAKYSQLGL